MTWATCGHTVLVRGEEKRCICMAGHDTHIYADGNGQPFTEGDPMQSFTCPNCRRVINLRFPDGVTPRCPWCATECSRQQHEGDASDG